MGHGLRVTEIERIVYECNPFYFIRPNISFSLIKIIQSVVLTENTILPSIIISLWQWVIKVCFMTLNESPKYFEYYQAWQNLFGVSYVVRYFLAKNVVLLWQNADLIELKNDFYSSKISRKTTVNSTKFRNPSPSVSPLLIRSTAASCVRISPKDAIEVLKRWWKICWQRCIFRLGVLVTAGRKRNLHNHVWTSWIAIMKPT